MTSRTVELVSGEPELREAAGAKRMDMFDERQNGIFNDITAIKSPRGNQLLSINRHMERISGDTDRATAMACRLIAAEEAKTVFDIVVRGKVQDVILPYKDKIQLYGPLTDVSDGNMITFITDEAYDIMDNYQTDIGLMGEELDEIGSINVNETQEDLAEVTYRTRQAIESIRRQMGVTKSKILVRKPEWSGLPYDTFLYNLATLGNFPDCSRYLKLDAQLRRKKLSIDQNSAEIMFESLNKVWVPDHINRNDIKLPSYDLGVHRFVSETMPISQMTEVLNAKIDDIPDIQDFDESRISMEL